VISKRKPYTYFLLLPALATIGLILLYPLASAFKLSLFKYNLSYPPPYAFIGFRNYIKILTSDIFRAVFKQNVLFAIGAFSIEFLGGFGIALLLNLKFKGRKIFRMLFLLPMLVAPVLVGFNWRWLLNLDYGLINQLLIGVGLEPKPWLVDAKLAMFSIIIADAWQYTPFCILLLLSGLQTLPSPLYEAASIDGASVWQRFVHLTLPLLRPIIFLTIILRVVDLFRVFDIVYIMTQGGPGGFTDLLPTYIYRITFRELRFGYGAAFSYIGLFISLLLVLPLILSMERQ